MLTLNDKETGAPVAYMSANVLSAYRTGAIPGVGFKHLAPADAKTAAIIGPGVMSRTALAAMMAVRPAIDTLKIKGRGQKSLQKFIDFVHAEYPSIQTVEACESIEAAVEDADIVYAATSSPTGDVTQYPYIAGDWLKPGVLVCTTSALCFDDEFLISEARTVTDNIMLYEAWEEEFAPNAYETIPIPAVCAEDLIAAGRMTKGQIDDLGDILTGKVPVHRAAGEKIIYSVGGMPVEDVAWGTEVYRRAKERGIGTKLKLWDVPAMA